MKYVVKVAGQAYEVEIEDISARPVIARVAGEVFEVSPENGQAQAVPDEPRVLKSIVLPKQSASPITGSNELSAPLPGTVIEIFVKSGDQIESGQGVLVIEALKMKNSIRSTRAGKIA